MLAVDLFSLHCRRRFSSAISSCLLYVIADALISLQFHVMAPIDATVAILLLSCRAADIEF